MCQWGLKIELLILSTCALAVEERFAMASDRCPELGGQVVLGRQIGDAWERVDLIVGGKILIKGVSGFPI